jgi:hypothetical protein
MIRITDYPVVLSFFPSLPPLPPKVILMKTSLEKGKTFA